MSSDPKPKNTSSRSSAAISLNASLVWAAGSSSWESDANSDGATSSTLDSVVLGLSAKKSLSWKLFSLVSEPSPKESSSSVSPSCHHEPSSDAAPWFAVSISIEFGPESASGSWKLGTPASSTDCSVSAT